MPSRSADLRRKLLLAGAPLAVVIVALAALIATRIATRQFELAATRTVALVAQRAAATVDLYLQERQATVALVAAIPALVTRARSAAQQARNLGLDGLTPEQLEARFADSRSLPPDPAVNDFLARLRDASDFAEVFFTERAGLIAAASNPTSDFVQSDEAWWRGALAQGEYQDAPEFDESAQAAALGLSAPIRDPRTDEPLGVLKAVLDLSRLGGILTPAGDTVAVAVELVDSTGLVVATAEPARLLRPHPSAAGLPLASRAAVVTLGRGTPQAELVASAPTNRGRWWVVAREPARARASAAPIRRIVLAAAALLLAAMLGGMLWFTGWLNRRVTQPVLAAGDVASRVASGDLSITLTHRDAGSEEVARLLRSVESMVAALRGLVGQIRTAAEDSAAMAQQISASTQEMSASTQEMANTCQSLTAQATQEAETVRAAAEDATRILTIATRLADGAKETAGRSAELRELAAKHRERLVAGSEQLSGLANDLEQGAADAQALAAMSEEIRTFVAQAREIGAQTNMLALNAAIEASRAAGGDTRGFAVVADEVRKLATQASRAASATAETVRKVLTTVQGTRDRLTRLVAASGAVREIADAAAGGLQDVARAAGETSAWTEDISGAASELRRLVEEISQRLDQLAQGTESVVAAAEQIAASAQEQSASTQEIASSASHLAESAERLTAAVSSFRVLSEAPRGADVPAASAAD
jgi:methyl-accepting chemotaxis protein